MHLRLLFLFCCFTIGAFVSCGDDDEFVPLPTPRNSVWDGPDTTFTKDGPADPTLVVNQDRLTDTVWLTRSEQGRQLYNAAVEAVADREESPRGTRWALGELAGRDTLNFQPFREAVGVPKDVVGRPLVAFLVVDSIYLSVRFTRWEAGMAGGFAYVRSTAP